MKVLLIGAGGHAKSCIACLEPLGIEIVGLIDRPELVGQKINGYEILGTDEDLPRFKSAVDGFLIAVGQLETASARVRLFKRLEEIGGNMPVIVSGDAFVDRTAEIGKGTIVMHHALLNASATVGVNGIINSAAIVEHDAAIGDHVHIATGAIVNGGCRVGNQTFIGSRATLRNGVAVGDNVVVGAGSVVVKDITQPGVYAGNPAKRLR